MGTFRVLVGGVCLFFGLLPFGLHAAEADEVSSFTLAAKDRRAGDYQSAERVLREGLASQGISRTTRVALTVSLADLLREEARMNEASALLEEASRMDGLTAGARINVLVERAQMDLDLRLWAESRALWKEIGEIGGREGSPLEADVDGGLGESWMAEGNLARAEPLLRRSLQLYRSAPRPSPLHVATALASMARLYLAEDKLALADEAVSEAIAKDEVGLSATHPQVALLRELRSVILSRHGDTDEARAELQQARVIMASHFGSDSVEVAVVYAGLGDVEMRAHQAEPAAAEYGNALRVLREAGMESSEPGAAVMARYSAAVKVANRANTAGGMTAGGTQSFREK